MTLRRACLAFALIAAAWAVMIVLTGGFSFQIAGARVSSRAPQNPALLAVASAAAALLLSRPRIGSTLLDDVRWWAGAVGGIAPATWLLLSGAALLVSYWAAARPLWLDEEMVALNIRDRAVADLTGPLWLGQGAPLGWLVTERAVAVAVGVGEAALRAVPVAFGIATLAAAWWVGRRWLSAMGAGVLVFLVAFGQWTFHYSLELKHYSADMCFGLLLPALVVWAMEASDARGRTRRAAIWWVVAAVGQGWSMGGLLVAPACALVLGVALWRRDGVRAAAACTAFGIGWLVVFAAHYEASLRFTATSGYLRSVWAMAMPPASSGAWERLAWLARQTGSIAEKPGGSGLPAAFWAAAAIGLIFARPPLLGMVFAAVPLTAAALAGLRLVPLFERLTIWALPALYTAIALAFDAGVRWLRAAFAHRRPWQGLAGALAAAAALAVCVDAGRRSWNDIPIGHPSDSNHQIDDRSGVRWIQVQLRPGDAILTTQLAAPAVWWYADASMASPARGASIDGTPLFEVGYHAPNPACDRRELAKALAPFSRALVYFGFRFDDVPDGFDDLLLRRLEELGEVTALPRFPGVTAAAVVDLRPPARREADEDALSPPAGSLDGCLSVQPAERW